MPLNEAKAYPKKSTLSKEQKREAEVALYGLPPETSTMEMQPHEIERMRDILAQHDAKHPKQAQTFDLNNPPKEPYVHQEFPRLVYHHDKNKSLKVENEKELKRALAQGFKLEPKIVLPEPEFNDVTGLDGDK